MRKTIINCLKLSISALVLTNFVNLTPSYAMEEYDLLAIFGQDFQDPAPIQNVIQNAPPGNPNDLIQFQHPAPQQNAAFQGNMGFQGQGHPQQGFAWQQQGYVQPQQGFAWTQQGYAQPQQGYAQPQQGYAQPQQGFAWPQQGYVQPQQGFAWPQQNVPLQGNMESHGQIPPQYALGGQNLMMFNNEPNSNKRKFDALEGNDSSEPAPKKFHAVASRHIPITAGEVFDELSCAYFTYYKCEINKILFVTKNYQWCLSISDEDTRVLDLLAPEYRKFFMEILKSSSYYQKNQVTKRQAYIMALNGGILKNPTNDLLEYIQDWRETGRATFQEFNQFLGSYLNPPDQPNPISLWNPVLALIEPANRQNGKYLPVEDYRYLQGMLRCFTEGSHLHFHKDFWLIKEAFSNVPVFLPKELISYLLHFVLKDYRSTKVMQNRR